MSGAWLARLDAIGQVLASGVRLATGPASGRQVRLGRKFRRGVDPGAGRSTHGQQPADQSGR
jgi:hypothetical protein